MKPPEGLRRWPDYRYLFAWLKVATKGLSDESRARIREEITDHFHDAIVEGLRANLTEDAAAEQAIEGLGNPKAARRAFHRTYLTRWQANIVGGFTGTQKPGTSSTSLWTGNQRAQRFRLAAIVVVLVAAPTALGLRHDTREWQLGVGIVVMTMLATIALTAVPRLCRRGRERAAVLLGVSAEFSLWVAYVVALTGPPPDGLGIRLWFLAVFLVVMAAMYLPLLRKLSKRRVST